MDCINTLGRPSPDTELWGFDALLTMKVIDVSDAGPIRSTVLKTLKSYFGYDFSKLVTDPGAIAGPGANAGTWTMSASTASTTQWAALEGLIEWIMQRVETVPAYGTLLQFTGGEFNGILLAGDGVLYTMTAFTNYSICFSPDSNRWDPVTDALKCATRIIYVQYRRIHEHIYQAFNLFDTAGTVVLKALGAVTAAGVLDRIQYRGVSILEALRQGQLVPYLIKGSKRSWNLVQQSGRPKVVTLGGETANTLEKLRRRLDIIDMKRYRPERQELSANERFTVLKTIATGLGDVMKSITGLEKELPTTFIDRFNMLTTKLHEENPTAYSGSEWNLIVESYIQNFDDFTNIIKENVSGWFMKLNAAVRAVILAGAGELTVTGAGTGTAAASPVQHGFTPTDLQFAANLLSQLAVIGGQLERAKFREKLPARVLRYAYLTGRVNVGGKKRSLMMVKVKESSKKTVYVARFVDNGYELIPNMTAWCNAPRY
jgi:hypothetical protein